MRCKAGRTGGPAAEDFELSRFYHFKQGAGDDDDGGEEEDCRMESVQPVLAAHVYLVPLLISDSHRESKSSHAFLNVCVCMRVCVSV